MCLPRARVLVVDDDMSLSKLICATVRMCGQEVLAVQDLKSAHLATIQNNGFDLVLLDLLLPDSSVESTLSAIPSILSQGARRVVVITAVEVTNEILVTALRAGASHVISKTDRLMQQIAATTRNFCQTVGTRSEKSGGLG